MSSSFLQLILDILLFAIIHYFITTPLMTKLLGFINGEHKTSDQPTVLELLKNFINEKEAEQTPLTPTFMTEAITGDPECECECGILLEDTDFRITRNPCHCTWCAKCVEECFAAVNYDLDAPLTGLSKHCSAAKTLTIRQMWPFVRNVVDEKTRRHIDTMGEIDLTKNDWMLDSDEVEK